MMKREVNYEGDVAKAEQKQPTIDIDAIIAGMPDFSYSDPMPTGEYLLDTVFQGKLSDEQFRNPYRKSRLQEVYSHPTTWVYKKDLAQCVIAADFKRTLIEAGVECSNFSYLDIAGFLKVTDETKREQLAAKASRERWDGHVLGRRVWAANVVDRVNDLLNEMRYSLNQTSERAAIDIETLENDIADLRRRDAVRPCFESEDQRQLEQSVEEVLATIHRSMDRLKRVSNRFSNIIKRGDLKPAA